MGVPCSSPVDVGRGDVEAHFVHVGFAQEEGARFSKSLDYECVALRRETLVEKAGAAAGFKPFLI